MFAAADPGTCRPMMCDPIVDESTRSPGVIEPLHVMEDGELGFGDEPHAPYRLPGDEAGPGSGGAGGSSGAGSSSSLAVPVLKDSTRHAFEARLRADWVGSRRVSFGEGGRRRLRVFLCDARRCRIGTNRRSRRRRLRVALRPNRSDAEHRLHRRVVLERDLDLERGVVAHCRG